MPPPTLRTVSCSARPIVEFARLPCPRTLPSLFIPAVRAYGPLTTTTGPGGAVVATSPCSANGSRQAASTAASTIGSSGPAQPASTALIATFSTVARPP